MAKYDRYRGGNRPPIGLLVVLAIFFLSFGGMGHAYVLLGLAAIGALTALLWRPVQVWANRLEQRPVSGELERQVTLLRSQVELLSKQQSQLQDTVRWQEQLLSRSLSNPNGAERTSTPSGR